MSSEAKSSFRRTGCFAVIILALAASLFLAREVYLALTAEPGSAVDYHTLARELVESYQTPQGENGWPALAQAAVLTREIWAQNIESGEAAPDYGFLRGLNVPREDEDPEAVRRATMLEIEAMEARGVWSLVDQAVRSDRLVRPMDQSGRMVELLLPELYPMSATMAPALAARMYLAHQAADEAKMLEAYELSLGLGRAATHQFTPIDHVAGLRIYTRANQELRWELVENPVSAETLWSLFAAMDRQSPGPMALALEGEHLSALDMIQWTHTDNGRGNGRLILTEVDYLRNFPHPGRRRPKIVNIAALAYPSKAETTALADEFFNELAEYAGLTRSERRLSSFQPDAFLQQIPKRFKVSQFLPRLGRMLLKRDQSDLDRAGTRLLLAIELHRVQTGAYPAALADLVPSILSGIPTDPFASDGRFIYTRVDPTADPFGRSYLLYSVGHDGTDDGGQVIDDQPQNALERDHPGTDYVFNLPRPTVPEPDVN